MTARCIALVGARGAGKSTLGRALAARLGRRFVDADCALEARHGRAIAEWMPSDAAGFRAAESALLGELLQEDAVLATGGGVVLAPANRELLAARATVIWIDAPPSVLRARLAHEPPRPPLLGAEAEDRTALYRELDPGGPVSSDTPLDRLCETVLARLAES